MTVKLRAGLAVALALSVAGCSEISVERPAPLDRFYYPIGVATTLVDGGATTALLVSSSNFDLRYSATDGGTLLSLDLAHAGPGGIVTLGAERIGSYAGQVAVADEATCPGIVTTGPGASALVASRYDDQVYQFGIGADGALSCGTDCVRGSPTGFDDPYAVTVACGPSGKMAYVGYLDPPPTNSVTNLGAWVSEIDLGTPGAAPRELLLGDGPVSAMAYDAGADRLWATTQSSGARALLHSVVLSDPRWRGANPTAAVDTIDLFPAIHGAELRTIAVGTSPDAGVTTRLFLTARLYDVEIQASTGTRPGWDVGGVLIVLDVSEGVDGRPVAAIRAIESLGLGVGDVAVVKRLGGDPDLVVTTAADEDLLFIYDDLTGGVVRAVAHNALGAPIVGDQSIGLAVSQGAAGDPAHVYVAAFGSHLITHFVLVPANPLQPLAFDTIGGLAP
jgi:hypothetical protein